MALFFYPLGYLSLRDENNKSMGRRDALATFFCALFIALPFVILPGTSYFGKDGFLSSIVNLCSALAGFYVAALVAAATLARGGDLDGKIEVGRIIRIVFEDGERKEDRLTRREYVCALFGYLSYIAFALAISLNVVTAIARSGVFSSLLKVQILSAYELTYFDAISALLKFAISLPIAHMFVVTTYGLYYLITRLYQQKPKIVPRSQNTDKAA